MANNKIVQTLLDYFTNPIYQRHGVSPEQPEGSGPGGAAATNMQSSRLAAQDAAMGNPEAGRLLHQDIGQMKMMNDVQDMKGTLDISNSVEKALKKKKMMRYNMMDTEI